MSNFKTSLKSSSTRLLVNVFGQVINTFGNLAIVPLFLLYWSKLEYGEWLVLTTVPSLLWSLEGGFAGLACNRMVLSSAVGDWKGANRLFQNIVVIQVIVSLLLIGAGYIVTQAVNYRPFFGITAMSAGDAAFILVVMLVYMSLGWCISLLKAPYYAGEKSPRGFMMFNCWRLTDFVAIGTALMLHGHGRVVALAQVANAALWVMLACLDITRQCPRFTFGLRDLSWSTTKTVFHDGFPLFLAQAGHAFYLQGYPLVLSRTLGPLAVVNFSAIRTVTRVLLQGILICSSAAALELSTAFAKKNWEVYLLWVKVLLAGVVVGGIGACLGLLFLGPSIIDVWTHGKVVVSGGLLLLFGISVVLQAAWAIFYMLLYTSNKHHIQCYAYFGITVGALLLGNFIIGRFGFESVPILMIAADVIVLGSAIHFCVRYLREVPFARLIEILSPGFYLEGTALALRKIRSLRGTRPVSPEA